MPARDPRLDTYIAAAAPFARPILKHLRSLVHEACPGVQETIKWGMPSFEFRGLLCGMAAFKAHATFFLAKGQLILGEGEGRRGEAMGHYGRITSLADLPAKRTILSHVREGARLNAAGVKVARSAARPARRPAVPADLKAALAKSAAARRTFEALPPGQQREYVDWIAGAKRETTRASRLAQAVEWLAEGKRRNWKYESC